MTWVGRTWWELELLPGWEARHDAECLTITRSDDSALQLSGAVKSIGDILIEELEQMRVEQTPPGSKGSPFTAGVFRGVNAGYARDGWQCQGFWLAYGNLLVYATYTGIPSAWEIERSNILAMLNSLRVIPSANGKPS